MKRILFIPEAVTNAHVSRSLVLAGSLNRQNYEVIFAASSQYKKFIEERGFEFYPVPTIPSEELLERLDKAKPIYTYQRLREYVEAELKLLKDLKPALIVGDFRISLGISCDITGIPYANLVDAHWSPFYKERFSLPDYTIVKIFGVRFCEWVFSVFKSSFLGYQAKAFNRLRRDYGLSKVGDLRYVYSYGTYTLYPDIPSLFPLQGLPANHLYLGPILYQPKIPLPDWWDSLPEGKPLIYVTLGSSGDETVYDEILSVLKDMLLIACIATAGKIKMKDTESKNIFWAEYLPGIELAKRASLIICNGGSGSVYQALSCGVPILAFPRNMDQYLIMSWVEKLGAGLLIRRRKAGTRTIKKAIANLLEDATFKSNSERLAEEIKNWDSAKRFSEFVGGLA